MLRIEQLTARQQKALEMLCAGASLAEVAARLNVRRETVWRWKQIPIIAKSLRDNREKTVEQAAHRIHELAMKAADVLGDLLDSDHDNIRLAASREVFARVGLENAQDSMARHQSDLDLSKLSHEELRTLKDLMNRCG